MLAMGINGRKQMLVTLRDLADLGACLTDIDFDLLVARAAEQRDELEPHRQTAGTKAFHPDE